jgi:hypothetical protein
MEINDMEHFNDVIDAADKLTAHLKVFGTFKKGILK